ncbi:MAG: hypothetical protein IT305_01650 [Chloroflexi bacterium]|nr:hypothetical protein [Chloroflexota bacterium]
MIARLLETFFRHKVLILLPVVITPLVVLPFAFLLVKPYYEVEAGVWVDRPAYAPTSDDWNRYITPAQNQQGKLTELLRTRNFVEDVARRTALEPLLATTQGREDVAEYLQRTITALPTGTKLLTIRVRTENADLSMDIIKATLTAFKERMTSERIGQASAAISFYEGQLKDASDQANRSQEALRRYVAANPRLTTLDPDRGVGSSVAARLGIPTTAIDPQLGDLLNNLDRDQKEADRIKELLERAKFDASASLEGNDTSFQVVDEPLPPAGARRERKRLLIFPAAALVAGLAVSATLLIGLAAADRSARSMADLRMVGRVVGVVPRMGLRRLPRSAGPETTRRAVAFVAGTTLPALPPPKASQAG